MKRILVAAALLAAALGVGACAGSQAAPEIVQKTYRLYDGPAPGSED